MGFAMLSPRYAQDDKIAREPRKSHLVTAPQAMRSPELPEGSVFMSSALAWMMIAVPPLLKRE